MCVWCLSSAGSWLSTWQTQLSLVQASVAKLISGHFREEVKGKGRRRGRGRERERERERERKREGVGVGGGGVGQDQLRQSH